VITEKQQLEVANMWPCAEISKYQLDRMRNWFTSACFFLKV